jgi:general secretion pathway protein I
MANRRSAGFTLLEVLIALVIAGLTLGALFRAVGVGLVAVDVASRYEEAAQRAQSHLAAVGEEVASLQGETEGDDGGGYRWRLRIIPVASWYEEAAASAPFITTLFDIEVAISWPSALSERSVALKTRRTAVTRSGR